MKVLPGIVLLLLCTAASLYPQTDATDLISPALLLGDTLDLVPAWYDSSFARAACRFAGCREARTEGSVVRIIDGRPQLSISIHVRFDDPCKAVRTCPQIFLLAWQEWSYADTIYRERSALVLARYPDSSRSTRWVLMKLFDMGCNGSWHLAQRAENTAQTGVMPAIQTFSGVPSGDSILVLARSWESSWGGFLALDLSTRRKRWLIGTEDTKGMLCKLVDGDLREATWESVVGRSPAKTFPEGKEKKSGKGRMGKRGR